MQARVGLRSVYGGRSLADARRDSCDTERRTTNCVI